ncbi:MAG TPA: hypothetical protein VGX68_25865 [Thermoanaerobaculia bacterium]|jgi:hypothetical protein|nr:hypothetical protein [Thermoanaerobaculia bacterium]
MTDSRNRFYPIAWRKPLLALLAGLALVLGMAAPHDVAVEQAGAVAKLEIAETAVHPDAPAHFEAAELKVHSGCVGCLLQLGANTVLKPPPAPLSPLSRDGRMATPAAYPSSTQLRRLGPARAPPSASLFT